MNNITIILCSAGVGLVTLIASIAMSSVTGVSNTYAITSGVIFGILWAAFIGYLLVNRGKTPRTASPTTRSTTTLTDP